MGMKVKNKREKERKFDSIMGQIISKLKDINDADYVMGFVEELNYWVKELHFFYNRLVPRQTGNPSTTYYTPSPRPKEGQVAYFNLRRGYPKEIYDGHYCYILKDFGTKYVVLPITSIKDGTAPNPNYEIDIVIKNFINDLPSRMHVDEIRIADPLRVKENKGIFDVKTDRNYIIKGVSKILLENYLSEAREKIEDDISKVLHNNL